jgi:hypothetical protein
VLIVYSVFTDYEWGIIKRLEMSYHLVVDFVASLFLAASPFLFGFANQTATHWMPHLLVGVVVMLVVVISQTEPGYGTTHHGTPHPA